MTMVGTNVTASGNGGDGFVFNSGASPNTLQYSNGTIAASGASFLVQGGATANIDLTAATATVNNGTLPKPLAPRPSMHRDRHCRA